MGISFKPIHYHETISEDGITHKVLIGEQQTAYQVMWHETFWNCDDKYTAIAMAIQELKIIKKQLEQELNERYSFNEVNDDISSVYKTR